jgi:hypothetical protein
MQHRQERRIHHQRLRVADDLGYHDPPQRLQETAQLPHAAVEGGRVQPHHAREEVGEEPRRVPEEGPLALHAAQLLEEGEREDLRVREPLERGVDLGPRVEEAIGVVDEAEQHGHGLFQAGRLWGRVRVGHLLLLVAGSRMAPFYS